MFGRPWENLRKHSRASLGWHDIPLFEVFPPPPHSLDCGDRPEEAKWLGKRSANGDWAITSMIRQPTDGGIRFAIPRRQVILSASRVVAKTRPTPVNHDARLVRLSARFGFRVGGRWPPVAMFKPGECPETGVFSGICWAWGSGPIQSKCVDQAQPFAVVGQWWRDSRAG